MRWDLGGRDLAISSKVTRVLKLAYEFQPDVWAYEKQHSREMTKVFCTQRWVTGLKIDCCVFCTVLRLIIKQGVDGLGCIRWSCLPVYN